jgi:hypothetical protein
MTIFIKVISGKIVNGLLTGTGEIYDDVAKYVKKGYFNKSKLNDINGLVINYNQNGYVLFQLSGLYTSDVPSGAMVRIEYAGPNTLDDILANNLTVPAVKKYCTYINGALVSVESEVAININVTYTKSIRGYFTNLVINEV